jgi:hypothetical protein
VQFNNLLFTILLKIRIFRISKPRKWTLMMREDISLRIITIGATNNDDSDNDNDLRQARPERAAIQQHYLSSMAWPCQANVLLQRAQIWVSCIVDLRMQYGPDDVIQ